jgi:D-beta-D-heptose 7-phosphate kinase/D-beta-D-heptose 1-phosphate adenosyltransferase
VSNKKQIPFCEVEALSHILHQEHKRIVFTNGCFDILHAGHVLYLQSAKTLGDVLVLGLNSDASVARLKGKTRPIVSETERSIVLGGLEAVDYICIFTEDTPMELIRKLKPDVLVKGGDWQVDQIVGADFVMSYGGEVRSLEFVPGISSSNIIERVVQRLST